MLRCLSFLIALSAPLFGQSLEQQIFNEITSIKTVDNHTHLNFSDDDRGYDALPCDILNSPARPPFRLRNEDSAFDNAARAVFGLKESSKALDQAELAAKAAKRQQLGD